MSFVAASPKPWKVKPLPSPLGEGLYARSLLIYIRNNESNAETPKIDFNPNGVVPCGSFSSSRAYFRPSEGSPGNLRELSGEPLENLGYNVYRKSS